MDKFYYSGLLIMAVFCAYRAMVSKRILTSTLFLACISAFVSIVLYLLGAQEVAVIELSVGAGLVTVLLVYALSVVGEDALDPNSIVSKPLALIMALGVAILLVWLAYSSFGKESSLKTIKLATMLWQQRVLDVWIQIALIFSGVMGILGLLSEAPSKSSDIRG